MALRRRLKFATTFVLAALVATAGTFGILALTHRPKSPLGDHTPLNTAGLSSCLTQPDAFISQAQLPGYRLFLNIGPFDSPPIHTIATVKSKDQPIAVQTFEGGELKGFITPLAYSGAAMAEQHAYEKKMKYAITNAPFVPLSGPLVEDNPTEILEAYQMNTLYSSNAGAKDYFGVETNGASIVSGLAPVALPGSLSEATAYHEVYGVAGEEDFYHVDLVRGNVEFDFLFRGGPEMPLSEVAKLVQNGINNEASACHSRRPSLEKSNASNKSVSAK